MGSKKKENLLYEEAANPETSIEELQKLAKKECFVRSMVAANPKTAEDYSLLKSLAKDEDEEVRCAVARNQIAFEEVLSCLAEDKEARVRCYVAKNPNTSSKILVKLSEDSDWGVQVAVAKHQNTPRSILVNFARSENSFVRRNVAKNPSICETTAEILLHDDDWEVRQEFAGNPSISLEMLIELTEDPVRSVVLEANAQIVARLKQLRKLELK